MNGNISALAPSAVLSGVRCQIPGEDTIKRRLRYGNHYQTCILSASSLITSHAFSLIM